MNKQLAAGLKTSRIYHELASLNSLADTEGAMFTGIITATASVLESSHANKDLKIILQSPPDWDDVEIGESIAVNGACLTVADIQGDAYSFLLVPETLAKTTFGQAIPTRVNLERALSVNDRFGGHFVQGHIDTTGTVAKIDKTDGHIIEITYPEQFKQFVIPKGSITVDGVALTVAASKNNILAVALIPHTLEHTTLSALRSGSSVNLEFDMLGKYVVNIMEQHAAS